MDFNQTKGKYIFEDGEAKVWGLIVIATEERIVEVTRLLAAGEHYPNEHDARSTRAQFTLPGNPPLEITKKRYKRMSIPLPYNELVIHIIRYFTYDFLICTHIILSYSIM